jgi:ATP-dependent protease HslVU (ClpYQ) peptidase subunit
MTTIVYDPSAGVMAADSRAYSGDAEPIGFKLKLLRVVDGEFDGALLGVSSNIVGVGSQIALWLSKDMIADFRPDVMNGSLSVLLVPQSGEVLFMNETLSISGPIEAPFYAIGTGAAYAKGAMAQGASAMQAVEIAKQFDVWSGGDVQMLEL